MTLDDAVRAGVLAQMIKDRQQKLDMLTNAQKNGWLVSNLFVTDPSTGATTPMVLDTLDTKTSAEVLSYTVQIYQAQMAALQGELDAIGTTPDPVVTETGDAATVAATDTRVR